LQATADFEKVRKSGDEPILMVSGPLLDIFNHPAMFPERRLTPRIPYCSAVEVRIGSAVRPGTTRDINADGMFIELSVDGLESSRIEIRIALRNSKKTMDLEALIVRRQPDGIGVRLR
jgi:hypothetical protein